MAPRRGGGGALRPGLALAALTALGYWPRGARPDSPGECGYAQYPGYRCVNQDLYLPNGATLYWNSGNASDCSTKCQRNDARCRAFTYDHGQKRCYPKAGCRNNAKGEGLGKNDKFTAGIIPHCKLLHNFDCEGSDLVGDAARPWYGDGDVWSPRGAVAAASAEDCSAKCACARGCFAFTWRPLDKDDSSTDPAIREGGVCYMKAGCPDRQPGANPPSSTLTSGLTGVCTGPPKGPRGYPRKGMKPCVDPRLEPQSEPCIAACLPAYREKYPEDPEPEQFNCSASSGEWVSTDKPGEPPSECLPRCPGGFVWEKPHHTYPQSCTRCPAGKYADAGASECRVCNPCTDGVCPIQTEEPNADRTACIPKLKPFGKTWWHLYAVPVVIAGVGAVCTLLLLCLARRYRRQLKRLFRRGFAPGALRESILGSAQMPAVQLAQRNVVGRWHTEK
eukprot:COSAG01_NODE_1114_length_11650_cov_28.837590_12_plen_448_part_00